jgi:hypothetical protein
VSNVSNGALAHPAEAIDVLNGMVRGGVLVDVVNGDFEVLYRWQNVDWLRAVPLDGGLGDLQDDPENFEACMKYQISIEPLP